jgi:hypothetical protein
VWLCVAKPEVGPHPQGNGNVSKKHGAPTTYIIEHHMVFRIFSEMDRNGSIAFSHLETGLPNASHELIAVLKLMESGFTFRRGMVCSSHTAHCHCPTFSQELRVML